MHLSLRTLSMNCFNLIVVSFAAGYFQGGAAQLCSGWED